MAGVDQFLKAILRSGVLDRAPLQETLRSVPKSQRHDPRQLADYLIAHGLLSRFQADKLLQGASRGLRLGPYVVQAPIGRGGMGTVFLARDSRTQLHVALKVLPPKKAREQERLLARFQREMAMSQRVVHPHIAFTYEAGVSQGVYYIAMEYIPGLSLHRLITTEGMLGVPRAARLFTEVAAALDYAHGQGLIHRDLKPSNIMVTPNDHAKILDLGLALIVGEPPGDIEVVGGSGYIVGTMDYIAPEQTTDATAIDPRADLYAVGCSLYFALTGQPPFPGGNQRDKILRHRRDEPLPLTQLNPAVPSAFAALVQRLMAKEPGARFPSAAALRQDLLLWVEEKPLPPVEQAGDTTYQHAVAVLETTAAPSELLSALVVNNGTDEHPQSDPIITIDERDRHELQWLIGGLIGFWVVLLAGFALVWLLG